MTGNIQNPVSEAVTRRLSVFSTGPNLVEEFTILEDFTELDSLSQACVMENRAISVDDS